MDGHREEERKESAGRGRIEEKARPGGT